MTKRRREVIWAASAAALLAMAGVGAGACSSADRGEVVGQSAEALTGSDVLGFESLSGWTLSGGTAALSTNHTQGSYAFSVIPNGYQQLTSVKLSTLSGVTSTLAIDFGMPATVPNPNWLGQLQIFASIPSQNVFNVQIGQTDLSTLKLGQYNTIQYAIPSAVLTALHATYTDLSFGVVVNVPSSTTTAYLLDNLRFYGSTSDAGTDASSDASSDGGTSDASTSCGTCASGTACAANGLCLSTDLTVWPNVQSYVTSDTWLAQNHTKIRLMQPRLLAINFANTATPADGYGMNSTLTFGEMKSLIQTQTCSGVHCAVLDGLSLGSAYHGYVDAGAPEFVQFQMPYAVDLSDKGNPPSGWDSNNSSLFPINCDNTTGYNFNFGALFGQKFASLLNLRDSSNNLLTLTQAIQKGYVHEIFIYADGDAFTTGASNRVGPMPTDGGSCPPGSVSGYPYDGNNCYKQDLYTCQGPDGGLGGRVGGIMPEVLEWKQNYNNPGTTGNPSQKIAGSFNPGAGNGTFNGDDQAALQSLGVSVRITYVNSARGPGCAIHSQGHAFENMGSSVPALANDFTHFANFDLNTKAGSPPFNSWYAVSAPPSAPNGDIITYMGPDGGACTGTTSCNALTWVNGTTETGTISPYNQGCGNVHFPPNAQKGYDDGNTNQVLSTCANYGLHNTNGLDRQTVVNSNMWSQPIGSQPAYNTVASDCEGGWQIFWRQSFPGYQNSATGSTDAGTTNGVAIKNWWPYLYY